MPKKWSSFFCLQCEFVSRKRPGFCKAFPEGIPHDIMAGYVSHFENVDGDGGIKYKLIEEPK